jgi:hypothetical protein
MLLVEVTTARGEVMSAARQVQGGHSKKAEGPGRALRRMMTRTYFSSIALVAIVPLSVSSLRK